MLNRPSFVTAARIAAGLLAALVAIFASSTAWATTKSFAAASAAMPSDVEIVVTSNLKSVRSTEAFKKLFPELLRRSSEASGVVDAIKKDCGVDPVTTFDDATLGLSKQEKGAVYIAMSGMTESKLVDCMSKVAKAKTKGTISTKKTGSITEVKDDKSGEKLFFAWLPGDVLAIATEPDDKPLLEKMIGGKGGALKSKIGARLAKLDSTQAFSVAWGKELPVDKMTVKNGALEIGVKSGSVSAKSVVEMSSAGEAKKVAAAANLVSTLVKVPKSAPKEVDSILKSLSASSNGSEATVSASATEKELAVALAWAIKEAIGP